MAHMNYVVAVFPFRSSIALQKRKVRAKLRKHLNVNVFFLGEEIKAQVLLPLQYRNDVIPLNAKRDAAGSVEYRYDQHVREAATTSE